MTQISPLDDYNHAWHLSVIIDWIEQHHSLNASYQLALNKQSSLLKYFL